MLGAGREQAKADGELHQTFEIAKVATLGGEWRLARILFVVTFVTAALYFAQDVFIPFALATLLSFLLSPLVTRLEHWSLRRIPAVLTVTLCFLACSACLGWLALNQFVDLAEKLPSYKANIEQKLQALHGRTGVALTKATRILQEFGQPSAEDPTPQGTSPTAPDGSASASAGTEPPPARVTVVSKELGSLDFLQNVIGPLLAPLGKGAIVMILVVFILIGREELRDRLIRLLGTTHMNITIQALDDAGERVSRYLLTQLAINGAYGAAISAGLYCIGVPNVLMWGLLATALRFLPYLGFWLAAVCPFLLALASPTWFQPLATVVLFGTLELIVNNLEPLLYGSRVGLSSVAVLGAALFWAWLWGAVGLLLSTPLTVVLVVLGRHVPRLAFLNVLLGDEPALQPHVRLYQRMLATDSEEAEDLFEEFTKGKSLTEAYDAFALPALGLAESDYHMDQIDDARRRLVHENMKELVQELGARRKQDDAQALVATADPAAALTEASRLASVTVLCLPARDEADEIAGTMLTQILQASGATMKTASVTLLASEMLEMIERDKIEVLCISAIPPSGLRHARYLYKRIRTKYPSIPIVVALLGSKSAPDKAKRLMSCSEDDTIAMTAAGAAQHLMRLVEIGSLRQQEAKKSHASAATEAVRFSAVNVFATTGKEEKR